MELSAGRQTLNMKAFILTMALVYVQQCEFAYLTDMFIGSLCLAMPPFHVMITHFLFVTPSYEFDFIDFIMMTFQLIFQADTSMACLLCWTAHSFTASCTHQHTHTYPTPNPLPVLKPAIWHKMDVVDRQTPWDTAGVAYEASVTGKAIYISLLRVFTDSDTISCSVWQAFDCEPGTEM